MQKYMGYDAAQWVALISLPKWAPIPLGRADREGIWQVKGVMG